MSIVAVLDQISSPEAAGYIRDQGWSSAGRPRPGDRALLVRERLDRAALEDCLAEPWVGGLEMAGNGAHPVGSCFRRHLAEGGLGLSIRSDTAYEGEIAPIFIAALSQRLLAPGTETSDMEFALHEMIANGLLHGNLRVGGVDNPDLGGMDGFVPRLSEALADSSRAARRIQISASLLHDRLELAVEDDGAGFEQADLAPDPHRPHGLALVEASVSELRIEEGGRRTVATFMVPARRQPPELLGLDGLRVLVVDDNKMNRFLLESLLRNMGVGNIDSVESGEKGLEAIGLAKPDLVLLDVMMPGMDGFEMCRRLRRLYPLTELPVVFVTALDGPGDRAACFAAGGTDMVSKPIDGNEVVARVGVHLRLGQAMDRLRAYQDRVNDELRAARGAQLALTPTPTVLAAIRRRTGLVVDGRIETSSELGGDFWTLRDLGGGQMGLLVADFTGHGPVAAFNVFRLHLLLNRLPRRAMAPSALLGLLNSELKAVLKPGQFACAFAGLFDVEAGTLTYASAAAPPPVLVQGRQSRFLDGAGPPLGAFADAEYEDVVALLPPGSAVLAYSDALTESLAPDGTMVCDDDALLAWVSGVEPGHSLAEEVLARFRERLPGVPPDDLTLVSVRRPG